MYIVMIAITVTAFVVLSDKQRLLEYYPTYLAMVVVGHVADRLLTCIFRVYGYTDPRLESHIVSLLLHLAFWRHQWWRKVSAKIL